MFTNVSEFVEMFKLNQAVVEISNYILLKLTRQPAIVKKLKYIINGQNSAKSIYTIELWEMIYTDNL